uniref:Uncharacterized protein n=1 Tax=Ditylenchus dipsaci TaxID=166011 RepID=A0A915CWD7_9BILA
MWELLLWMLPNVCSQHFNPWKILSACDSAEKSSKWIFIYAQSTAGKMMKDQAGRNFKDVDLSMFELYDKMTAREKHQSLWLAIERIANNDTAPINATLYNQDSLSFNKRRKRQNAPPAILLPFQFISNPFQSSNLAPVILSPFQFSPTFGLGTLGPLILSPFIFSPPILNPTVLSPFVLSPGVADPTFLAPMCSVLSHLVR